MKRKYEIYAYPNPCWLADTFIFRERTFHGMTATTWGKITSRNKIEEIGVNLIERCHGRLKGEWIKEATKLQKSILNRIDDEYWSRLFNNLKDKMC